MKKIFFISAAVLLALTGCVKDEMFKGPSTIAKVVFSPEAPTSITPVQVTANVTGLQAVTSATLNYNGGTVTMTGSGTNFTATIPAMEDGTEVNFTIVVNNEAGFTTTSDKYSYKVGDPAPDWSKLKLNEVYGAGADEEKYFELYNGSDFPIKLTGVTISKDEANGHLRMDGQESKEKPLHLFQGQKLAKVHCAGNFHTRDCIRNREPGCHSGPVQFIWQNCPEPPAAGMDLGQQRPGLFCGKG